MEERKVKGMVLLGFANLIRSSPNLPWKDHLTEEDLEIVNSGFLPSQWYSAEAYNRMALAVYKLVHKGDPDWAREFGRASIKELIKGGYGTFLTNLEPAEAMKKYFVIRSHYINFAKMAVEKTGNKSCRVTISETGKFDESDLYQFMFGAQFEELIEANGGKEPKFKYKVVEGREEPTYIFDLEWK
ncbi:MAG TPA: hypothetical protein VM658_08960 [bacterium]|nr:hypothetical protein [bacterium]